VPKGKQEKENIQSRPNKKIQIERVEQTIHAQKIKITSAGPSMFTTWRVSAN
jgi:hypothetical protein